MKERASGSAQSLDLSEAPPECTLVVVAVDGWPAVALGIADRPRPGAAQAVADLREAGIEVHLATGDREPAARAVAERLGLNARNVHAGLAPEAKESLVRELRAAGRKVGFLGDGINDARALAAATVGFAVGSGTALAMQAADVTLKAPDVAKVLEAIRIARAARRAMVQNLAWAFGYNILALPVAASGLLHPMLAAGAMALSDVSVVLNALRLRRGRLGAPAAKKITAPLPSGQATATLSIQGMSCDHCVGQVEKALRGLPGVTSAEVQLKAGAARVSYDPQQLDAGKLAEAVKSAGFRATPVSTV